MAVLTPASLPVHVRPTTVHRGFVPATTFRSEHPGGSLGCTERQHPSYAPIPQCMRAGAHRLEHLVREVRHVYKRTRAASPLPRRGRPVHAEEARGGNPRLTRSEERRVGKG